jgi:hypothetical protein
MVDRPLQQAGLPSPRLVFLSSPHRHLVTPLLRYLKTLEAEYPGRQLAVIVPELVETRWFQYLLHNQTAVVLKAALLLRGDRRMVVINVPWYLGDEEAAIASPAARGQHPTTKAA